MAKKPTEPPRSCFFVSCVRTLSLEQRATGYQLRPFSKVKTRFDNKLKKDN